jgi:hypothetical protein
MEFCLTEPPEEPTVAYDELSGEFVVSLSSDRKRVGSEAYRGRLIHITSSNPDIKP